MWKTIFTTAIFMLSQTLYPQLLLNEGFTGFANGNLGTGNGWVQTGSGTDVQVASLSAMTFEGYNNGGGSYVSILNINGTDPYKTFVSPVTASVSSTFYLSFLIRVNSGTTTPSITSAEYVLALRNTSNTNYLCRFFAGKDASGNLRFGIAPSGNNATSVSGEAFLFNTTYLILIRYDLRTGSNNDLMYLWVNPPGTNSPSLSDAAAATTGSEAAYGAQVNAIMMFQRGSSLTPALSMDGFKLSNAADPSIAWKLLPVYFSGFALSMKENRVQLSWCNEQETEVTAYTVETSADGKHWERSTSVNAIKNDGSRSCYQVKQDMEGMRAHWFRICAASFSGRMYYSSPIKCSGTAIHSGMNVFPNPVKGDHIYFGMAKLPAGTYRCRIINAVGQMVSAHVFVHAGGSFAGSADVSSLPGALYFIRFGDGVIYGASFVKHGNNH